MRDYDRNPGPFVTDIRLALTREACRRRRLERFADTILTGKDRCDTLADSIRLSV